MRYRNKMAKPDRPIFVDLSVNWGAICAGRSIPSQLIDYCRKVYGEGRLVRSPVPGKDYRWIMNRE